MNAKWTPGPWEAVVDSPVGTFVRTVARVVKNDPGKFPPEFQREILSDEDYPAKGADARLIAAAPEMAELLARIVAGLDHGAAIHVSPDDLRPMLKEARALLASLEGVEE